MKLTDGEKKICEEYSKQDPVTKLVGCSNCPLALHKQDPLLWEYLDCYANIDGRSKEARHLKRF